MARLHIYRGSERYGMFRKLKVFVDDKQIGAIGQNETAVADLMPGTHTVVVKMDWGESSPLTLVARGDENLHVDVEVGDMKAATLRTFLQPKQLFGLRLR